MFDSLFGFVAIVAILVIMSRQQKRLNVLERELTALRGLVQSGVPAPDSAASETAAPASEVASTGPLGPAGAHTNGTTAVSTDSINAGPWERKAEVPAKPTGPAETESAASMQSEADRREASGAPAKKRDIETALGTRWAVWVGGLALALGGLFLIRYTIESGVFGPHVRLAMAAILGLAAVGAGEFIRRTGFRVPLELAAGAYIPAILTAAGAFISSVPYTRPMASTASSAPSPLSCCSGSSRCRPLPPLSSTDLRWPASACLARWRRRC